jgi:hypothetical protein
MSKPRLGSGKRFKTLANKMAREGVEDPNAAAASIGIKKYGENKMHKLAMAGKKRHSKESE